MILKLKIEVSGRGDAYNLINEISQNHLITEAEFDKQKEIFDKKNRPKDFLKNKETANLTKEQKIERLNQMQKELKLKKYES